MIAKSCLAVAAVLLALPLIGQDPPKAVKPTDAKAAEMTEDVEILRLLLNKSLGLPRKQAAVYYNGGNPPQFGGTFDQSAGGPTGMMSSMGTPFFAQHAPLPAESFDGVYLKGHGIAYTIRLSALGNLVPHEKAAGMAVTCQNCHAVDMVAKFNLIAANTTAKPPSDWEKARDELRGVPSKVDPNAAKPNVAEMCVPGNLTETVTKLLAANGRHLRQLTADENVSVVITYEGLTGAATDRVTGTMADPSLWNQKTGEEEPYAKFGLTADESKQIVLGDLHMKQSKYADAVKAYELALGRFASTSKTLTPPRNVKPADVDAAVKELHASVTSAYRSMAQAYIGVGNLEEAKRALELAQKLELKIAGSDAKTKGTPVPTKLILTVKKSHLDAAEKLGLVEFRKGVTVETVGLSAAKK